MKEAAEAVIVAAGSSRRLGFDKLTVSLAGEPVLLHTARAFDRCKAISRVIVVARPDRVAEFEQLLKPLQRPCRVLPGGEERCDSVWQGLKDLSPQAELVAVHDGARPLVTAEIIESSLEGARRHGSGCIAAPVTDTLLRAGDDHVVEEHVSRAGLWAMQTPQTFQVELIRRAYDFVIKESAKVTDEASALELIDQHAVLVPNTDWNFKITYERDIDLAEAVLRMRKQKTR